MIFLGVRCFGVPGRSGETSISPSPLLEDVPLEPVDLPEPYLLDLLKGWRVRGVCGMGMVSCHK